MIPPRIKNKLYFSLQKNMRPISIRLSEDMIGMLEETASEKGFNRIQELLRLYIRQGLDRDHAGYSLANDEVFLNNLRQKGISLDVIKQALVDTPNHCNSQSLVNEQLAK